MYGESKHTFIHTLEKPKQFLIAPYTQRDVQSKPFT